MSLATASATQKLISASLLRLRMKTPFFATLALFTRFIPTHAHPTAATDGKDIYFNPDFLAGLRPAEQDGLLLHEVLHAALLHALRRGVRDRQTWNIAADIVVNGIIAQQPGFALPQGGIRDEALEQFSVEEVYELLQQQQTAGQQHHQLMHPDLLSQPLERSNEASSPPVSPDDSAQSSPVQIAPAQIAPAQIAQLEAHWQNALQQAMLIVRTTQQGNLPAGMERELGQVTGPQLDWRSHLWRYLVQTPTDFQGFDRRFVHQGLYLEILQGESVQVYVCVDTSGSIDAELLRLFLGEVRGILSAYPHLHCELYYADAAIYGPYELDGKADIPPPQGGGGTSFVPFFKQVGDRWDQTTQAVCIYLTDGYGTFPTALPELPTLWVVAPGGLDLGQFPFGEAVRLLSMP